MALKPYSEKTLRALLEAFNVPEQNYRFRPLTNGLINDTFLAQGEKGNAYVLQRINTSVFPNVSGLMNNMERGLSFLKDSSYPPPLLLKTAAHKRFIFHSGLGYWRAMRYMPDSISFDTTQKPEIAFECGKVIANFHRRLRQADPEAFTDTIPDFHRLDARIEQFEKALGGAKTERLKNATEAIAFAKDTGTTLIGALPKGLPDRICHNDTKLNNILFSKKTGKALCLIDLDTLMKGYFHYDFGDAVRTLANPAPEDGQDRGNITFDLKMFAAFAKGLAHSGPFLNDNELKAASFGALLMPFLHGIRALTDYLNNDLYYKTIYKEQNLDRCRSLFNFTAKAQSHIDAMSHIVRTTLKPV